MRCETVIGLEVHAQLATQSKLFSESDLQLLASPQTLRWMLSALVLPGVLPVPNGGSSRTCIRAGLGLG